MVEGGFFAPRFSVSNTHCWELVCTRKWVYAALWRKRVRELWRVPLAGGVIECVVENVDIPELTTTAAGELVYAREERILVRDDEDRERAIKTPSPVRGTCLRCAGDSVFYTTGGRICRAPLAAGEPEICLENHSESEEIEARLGPFAVTGDRIAVVEERASGQGQILERSLVIRELADRSEITRLAVSGRIKHLRAMGDHVVWTRVLGPGGRDRIESSIGGSPPRPLADRVGDDLCLTSSVVLYGDRAELRSIALTAITPSTITARERAVVDAIRAANGAYELTTIGGRSAFRTTQPNGSRSIQVVSEACQYPPGTRK